MRLTDVHEVDMIHLDAFGHEQLLVTEQLALKVGDDLVHELLWRVKVQNVVIEEELISLCYS